MRLNNNVFQWHYRMPEVFEEHKQITNANRVQYENSLKVSLPIQHGVIVQIEI